jgi:hypothetical protein
MRSDRRVGSALKLIPQMIAQAAAFPIVGRSAFVLGQRPAYPTLDFRSWREAGGQPLF